MTSSHQVSSGVRQRLTAPRGHRFSRPGSNRQLAAPPAPPEPHQARQEGALLPPPATPRDHRFSGPFFTSPESHQERQERLLRQMRGNPRVAHMLRHGPRPHWFEVARQRQEQAEREVRRLQEAFEALPEPPTTPTRGRHRAPRPWWGWPAVAISASLLFTQSVVESFGQAIFQTVFPL